MVYGRTTFLKEPIFGEVKSLRKKKFHNKRRDQNVAGAPEVGCLEMKPCACTKSRTVTLRAQGRVGTHTIRTHTEEQIIQLTVIPSAVIISLKIHPVDFNGALNYI